jgi:hypothetical protein
MDKKEIDYTKMAKRFAKSSGIDCKKLKEEARPKLVRETQWDSNSRILTKGNL